MRVYLRLQNRTPTRANESVDTSLHGRDTTHTQHVTALRHAADMNVTAPRNEPDVWMSKQSTELRVATRRLPASAPTRSNLILYGCPCVVCVMQIMYLSVRYFALRSFGSHNWHSYLGLLADIPVSRVKFVQVPKIGHGSSCPRSRSGSVGMVTGQLAERARNQFQARKRDVSLIYTVQNGSRTSSAS
jgi:hypothetical protein